MWQTLHKLAKILYDIPGAKYVAEMVRAKVEKFRQYVPLLQTICNKGLQERHWQQVIVGNVFAQHHHWQQGNSVCNVYWLWLLASKRPQNLYVVYLMLYV